MEDSKNTLMQIKIIRCLWGDKVLREIPPIPTIDNQIVYVWGRENEKFLRQRGYEVRFMEEDGYSDTYDSQFHKKLIALDLSLQEFGEVLLLDWDCHILRPLDETFFRYIKENPIQVPLYSQCIETKKGWNEICEGGENESFYDISEVNFNKHSWKHDNMLVTPNFCYVYSRDKEFGKKLIDITLNNNILGCIEEHAMFIYSNCDLNTYINRYQPKVVRGVSNDNMDTDFEITKTQKRLNDYLDTKIEMDIYLKHI